MNAKNLVDDGHGDLTFRVIGVCMAVHNELGPGHREIVYQRALARKFRELSIPFEEQVPLPVLDSKDVPLIIYRVDFRIANCTWLEIKGQRHQLTGDERAQTLDYFTADEKHTCDVGLLVNFGRVRLEWERLFPPRRPREQPRKQWGRQLKDEPKTG